MVNTPPKEHFQVKNTEAWSTEDQEHALRYSLPQPQQHYNNTINTKNIDGFKHIWNAGCWLVIIFNTLFAAISIRDMFLQIYSPTNHYFMIATFTGTIGALALIQKYVIDRGK